VKLSLRPVKPAAVDKVRTSQPKLLPQARVTGTMPWVIAIMVMLMAIAVAGGLALRNMTRSAAGEVSGGITVQLVEPRPEVRDAQARKVATLLGAMPDVSDVEIVPQGEIEALVEPWLGASVGEAEVPVPGLVDARLDRPATPQRVAAIGQALRQAAPSARVDAQANWLKPVFGAIRSLQWLAIVLVILLSFATASAVLLATRTALGANRETIEVVHLLGGTDGQIASIFQRSTAISAAEGGALGLAAAAIVVILIGNRFAVLGSGIASGGSLAWTDWVIVALVPVAATVLATVTARLTVLRTLARLL